MRAILDMLRRDLLARLRDRSAIVIGLLAPIALITIFSLLAGGPDVGNQPFGYVAARPPTTVDRVLGGIVLPQLAQEKVAHATAYADRAAAAAAVRDEKVDAALVSTPGDPGGLEVLRRDGAAVSGAIAEGVARATVAEINGVATIVAADRALGAPVPADPVGNATIRLAAQPAAVNVRTADQSAGGLSAKTQIAAGMATFFLFFTVQFGLLGLLQERRQGTLARLLAAPITPAQVLAAKLLVSFVLGVLSMGALLVFARLLLGAHFGNPLGVGLLVVCGVAAATATVSLVAGVARTPDQAGIAQSMVALVLGILGGSFFSMARAGGVGAVVTKLTPHYWFGDGLVRMTGGGAWTDALVPAVWMLVFAVLVGLPGLLLARRVVRP